jgi:pimeloyl-ACP methyl ester carboxylesterase
VTATEWGAAMHKAESFWHGALRPRAEKFLSLPVGPRLRYHVWGETNDPDVVDVVLLHDLGEAGGGLSDLGVALARRGYRVWAPDFRGHGDSDRALPYDDETLVEDTRAFFVELDLYRRPAVLVGFGLGAFVAMAFAATHPALAGGIVLIDAEYEGRRTKRTRMTYTGSTRFKPRRSPTSETPSIATARPSSSSCSRPPPRRPAAALGATRRKRCNECGGPCGTRSRPRGKRWSRRWTPSGASSRRAALSRCERVRYFHVCIGGFFRDESSFTERTTRRDVDGTVRASTPARARRTDTASPGPRD